MTRPQLAELGPDLKPLQERWLQLPRKQQDLLYAKEFVQPFAELFARLPLHGAPENMPRPRALISVLGLSWQPVALMAAWCRPEHMLVIGTEESLRLTVDGESVLSLVARVASIPRDTIDHVRVGDPGEAEIYRAVRDFLRECDIPTRQVFVDPTGGKKSMSAAAALAGFLAGAPLVYVDYGAYHGPNRIPVAGTEYPRLLTNPLEVLGDLELRDVFAAFNRSDFQEAARLAIRVAERLYEPREAECLAKLAQGYGAWDRFDFTAARQALQEAEEVLRRFAAQGRWSWAAEVQEQLRRNLAALDELVANQEAQRKPSTIEEGVPILVWYLAKARRLLEAEKLSLAVLLTYAAVERYIDLCLLVVFGLDHENPDYTRVAGQLDMDEYHRAGRQMFGQRYRERPLDGPLMFANGAQLLATLDPERLGMADLGRLLGLSKVRNKSEYEHGSPPVAPSREDAERYLKTATEIVSRICGGPTSLEEKLRSFAFPKLPTP